MANVSSFPAEGQILVNIEDMSMLKDIKKAISLLKGVGKITVPRRRKRYSAYELSLRDLDEGRVYEAKDVDDLFRQCLEDHQVHGRIQAPDEVLRASRL